MKTYKDFISYELWKDSKNKNGFSKFIVKKVCNLWNRPITNTPL